MADFTDGDPVGRQHPGADELPAQDPLGAGDVRPPPVGRCLEEFPFGARTEVPRVDDVRRCPGPVSADQRAPRSGDPGTRRIHIASRGHPGADGDGLGLQDRHAQPSAVLGELRRIEASAGQHPRPRRIEIGIRRAVDTGDLVIGPPPGQQAVGAAQVGVRPLPYRPEPSLVTDGHRDEHPVGLPLAYDVAALVTSHDPPVGFDVLIQEFLAGDTRGVLPHAGDVGRIQPRIDGLRDPPAGAGHQYQHERNCRCGTKAPLHLGSRRAEGLTAAVGSRAVSSTGRVRRTTAPPRPRAHTASRSAASFRCPRRHGGTDDSTTALGSRPVLSTSRSCGAVSSTGRVRRTTAPPRPRARTASRSAASFGSRGRRCGTESLTTLGSRAVSSTGPAWRTTSRRRARTASCSAASFCCPGRRVGRALVIRTAAHNMAATHIATAIRLPSEPMSGVFAVVFSTALPLAGIVNVGGFSAAGASGTSSSVRRTGPSGPSVSRRLIGSPPRNSTGWRHSRPFALTTASYCPAGTAAYPVINPYPTWFASTIGSTMPGATSARYTDPAAAAACSIRTAESGVGPLGGPSGASCTASWPDSAAENSASV